MKNDFITSIVERANNMIETNKLEERVTKLKSGIQDDLISRHLTMDQTVGKTVARVWHDYETYVLIFKDETYLALSMESYDCGGALTLMAEALEVEDGIEAGLVEPRDVQYLREAEKAWREPLDLLAAKKQLLQAITTLGPDAVKEFLGE